MCKVHEVNRRLHHPRLSHNDFRYRAELLHELVAATELVVDLRSHQLPSLIVRVAIVLKRSCYGMILPIISFVVVNQRGHSERENRSETRQEDPEALKDGRISESASEVEVVDDEIDEWQDGMNQQGHTRSIDVILNEENRLRAEIIREEIFYREACGKNSKNQRISDEFSFIVPTCSRKFLRRINESEQKQKVQDIKRNLSIIHPSKYFSLF